MHGILLAGGKGTRLARFTEAMPKVLLPVGGIPVIELLIAQLRREGVFEDTIVTSHLADVIQESLGSGKRLGVDIRYWLETQPLDTAGCLGQFVPSTTPFLLINADIVTDLRFTQLLQFHQRLRPAATVAACRHRVHVDFGVVECEADGRLQDFKEKPDYDLWVNMGIYCLDPRACDFVSAGERISMPDLLLRLRDAGENVLCYRADCSWRDIGRVEDYTQANKEFAMRDERTHWQRAA